MSDAIMKIINDNNSLWKYKKGDKYHIKTILSGKHVTGYFNSNSIISDTKLLDKCVEVLVSDSPNPDWVVSFAPYGMPIAMAVARNLDCKFAYAYEDSFDIDFNILPGESVLIVVDEIYGGGSVSRLTKSLQKKSVEVVPNVYCLANLSSNKEIDSLSVQTLVNVKIDKYNPDDCPMCVSGSIALTPRDNWEKLILNQC